MNMAEISLTQLKQKNLSILNHLHPDVRSCQLFRQQIQPPRKASQYKITYEAELKLHLKQRSHYHMNLGKAYAFLFGQCRTGLQHRIKAKAESKSKIKGNPINLLEMIKENSSSFDEKKKADIVIIDAIMNLMTTRQRDNEDLTKYTKHFKVVRDLCKEKYGGILKITMITQKEYTWGSDPETSYKTEYARFYPSCISRIWIKQSMVHSSRRWQKLLSQLGRMSTQSTSRMHNIFCPSTSMTKLITISIRSNQMTATNAACPQRMTIVQPQGMCPI